MKIFRRGRLARPQGMSGVASIEFALIAIILLVMLVGALVYWRAFQAQQSLTRATGDGARAILGAVVSGTLDPCHPSDGAAHRSLIQQHVQRTVQQSLGHSDMPGVVGEHLTVGPIQWQLSCASGDTDQASFEVVYTLPPLWSITNSWIPEPTVLRERSVVHFDSLL